MDTLVEAVEKKRGRSVRLRPTVSTSDTTRPLIHLCGCGQSPTWLNKLFALFSATPAGQVRSDFDRSLRAFIGKCGLCGSSCVTPLE